MPEGHHRLLLGGVQHRGQLETDALARGLGLRAKRCHVGPKHADASWPTWGRRKLAHAFLRVYSTAIKG